MHTDGENQASKNLLKTDSDSKKYLSVFICVHLWFQTV